MHDPAHSAAEACALRIEVALVPSLVRADRPQHARTVYIVVDVIRATTTLCMLFERGCQRVYVAHNVTIAREMRARLGPDILLAGEVAGARPEGFDLGNSPAEAAEHDLHGRAVLLATTNGTRALHACQGGGAILTGALRNASAVAAAALQAAATLSTTQPGISAAGRSDVEMERDDADIVVVCSGRGDQPAYDDTVCAGYLVERMVQRCADEGRAVTLSDGARLATATLGQALAAGSLRDALADSAAARAILQIGLGGDLDWCAEVDATRLAPTLVGRDAERDLPVLEAQMF